MTKTVAIVVALDTKGDEAQLIKTVVESRGVDTLIIDVGVLGEPTIEADVTRAEVATAGGSELSELLAVQDKGSSMATMTRGAAEISRKLYDENRFDGIIGLGGTAGTAISSSAMRALPVGVPKMLVSTVASGDTRPYVGTKDITMMYSVVDIAGINRLSADILTNAAGAIAGMVSVDQPEIVERPMLAASMFGNTTACVDAAREILDKAGYEVVVFHATGAGGETMESLIADGVFQGVLDLTTTEWADHLCGGVFDAGAGRLDAASQTGTPQVIAPGCLDMVNFGAPDTVPEKYKHRLLYEWNANVTLMRTTPEENAELGRIIAEKANASSGPATILLPLKGVSQLDSQGGEFWWPEADGALFEAIRKNAGDNVQVVELDHNINDPEFAERATAVLMTMLENQPAN